jgi:hypothetical protein
VAAWLRLKLRDFWKSTRITENSEEICGQN